MSKVFVTRAIPQEAIDVLTKEVDLEVWPKEHPPTHAILVQKSSLATGILTNIMDKIDRTLLAKATNLKVISQMAAGLDNVDVEEATLRGIPVGYTPDVVSSATADQSFALMLAAARRVCEVNQWVRNGNWKIAFHPLFWLGTEVHHATIGIIGMGNIGTEMAKRAIGFDMKVLYHSRRPKPDIEGRLSITYVDLETLLKESDFVSLHVPLNPTTHHLIGRKELDMMKSTSILINTARGAVVDTKALYESLKDKKIAGAALDVTYPEPISRDDPLLHLNNLVLTPHLGSSTKGTRTSMAILAAQNLLAGLKEIPLPQCANPMVYKLKD